MRNKHQYFYNLAETASEQSTCLSKQVGCVFVSEEKFVLAIGYNGSPSGMTHCEDRPGGCHRPNGACEDTIHAEQNAILQSVLRGTSLKNAIVYCTLTPCKACAMSLIQLGIKKIHCRDIHSSFLDTKVMLANAGIPVLSWEGYNRL